MDSTLHDRHPIPLPHSQPVSTYPELGSEFAGYRLESYVARGGMGVVYRAAHMRLQRAVALKLLAPELAEDRDFRERFLKEATIAAKRDRRGAEPCARVGRARPALPGYRRVSQVGSDPGQISLTQGARS